MSVPIDPISEATQDTLQPTLVRASAGTGKTYQLTARLLKILLQGASPETILATTFTRKAAGEILQRILSDLAFAADPDEPAALEKLRHQIQLPGIPAAEVAKLLTKLVRNVHRFRICTLDSLFSQLARSFPFELKLPPAWRLSDEIEEARFRRRAIGRVIGELDPSETTTLLSMLAKGEVKRSIAQEIQQVIDVAFSLSRLSGDEAWHQLTLVESPPRQDWTRVAGDLRMAASDTKNKRHQTKLNELAERLELGDIEAIAGDTLLPKIGQRIRGQVPLMFYNKPFDESLDAAFEFIYRVAQSHTLVLLRAQNEATGRVLDRYDTQINGIKQNARVLGFEDIAIRLASALGQMNPSSLDSRMDGAVDHLLLDEFQDTSAVQWQVLRPMARHAAEVVAGEGKDDWQIKRSFFCVGDTKQAIYSWRGGVAEIFETVSSQIPGIQVRNQDESFRSSPVVINVVNQIFQHLDRHPLVSQGSDNETDKDHFESIAVRNFTRSFPAHKTAKKHLPGIVRFVTSQQPVQPGAKEKRAAAFDDAALLVADLVNNHNTGDQSVSIGVLTRTNAAVAEMILRLERMGVDVSQEGGNPLVDSAAVEVVLSALMVAEHPGDKRWAFHTSNTPLSIENGWTGDRIRRLIFDRGLAETIEQMVTQLVTVCDDRDTSRLEQLVSLAIAEEENPSRRIRDFVERVRIQRVQRPRAAKVRVMTVHQSKGLEFDHVVLPQIDGELVRTSADVIVDQSDLSRPPSAMTRYLKSNDWHYLTDRWLNVFGGNAAGKMTEALCLMYVATTRARQGLYMIVTPDKNIAIMAKTFACLMYHALGCTADPAQANTILYESNK
jgi:ATP-dependent helicase/nuclease subunit A